MTILSLILATASLAAPSVKGAETLWREWYLITQNGVAIGYFEETAERRPQDKQLAVTQNFVEKVDGKREAYVGSVSTEADLDPVAFFVDRKAGTPEKSYKVDARVKGRNLEITLKPASPAIDKSTKSTTLSPSTIFSSFLPIAIARTFKGKAPLSFTAVVEDSGEMTVVSKKGLAEPQKEEKKIASEACRHAVVHFGGQLQHWWVTKAGKTCLVEFPDSGTKVELSNEKQAKKAVEG
jgi:hypothetical protein